ncbi:hypothetical protein [Rhodococcus ruber]|uniref:hypothetical protein n=1 Tax=Rhodococcus ruber TaxID=1830 RepID=UPI0011227C97|nr:hypothetical protein [Rhodococcus ruber]QDC13202.1 hypothetical protein E2561_03450 [Rhodococcus ruber]
MTSGPTSEEYLRLPGPLRFIADVASHLRAGLSVVVVFPDAAVDTGLADHVLEEIAKESARSEFCTQSCDTFPTRVIDTFGADPVRCASFDEWESIIQWEAWHDSWVVLSSWDHTDIPEILERWPAQVHASGLSQNERPKLLVGGRLSEVPRHVLTRLDSSLTAVHWWWGVLDRLDTETRLVALAGRTIDPVDTAVIVEVSGWDLACVDFLIEFWDRSTSGLAHAVREYQAHAPGVDIDSRSNQDRRPSALPPADREEAWQKGLLDRWGHSLRRSPRVLDDKSIDQRIWMAHNRALISHVDEERAHYEEIVRREARKQVFDELDRRDDNIIEIGSLTWLVASGRVRVSRDDRERLCTFRDLRNDLAHRVPINDELLMKVAGYLGFEQNPR